MQAKMAQKVNFINILSVYIVSRLLGKILFFLSQNNKHIEQEIKTCTCVCKQDFWLTNTYKPWKNICVCVCVCVSHIRVPNI